MTTIKHNLRKVLSMSFLFFSLFTMAQVVEEIDSTRFKPFLHKSLVCYKELLVESFRNEQPTDRVLYYVDTYIHTETGQYFQMSGGTDNSLVEFMNRPFRYFQDRESNADSSSTGIYVVNLESYGGIICHKIEYDREGKKISDEIISKRKFNSIARERNERRQKQLVRQYWVNQLYISVPTLPFEYFGKPHSLKIGR